MINLLRLREMADYSTHPALAPASPISGAQAFDRYVQHTLPFLRASGGDIVVMGAAGHYLIGPAHERWDLAMVVRQHSVETFLGFAHHPDYLAGLGHRAAALEDSRLLALAPFDPPQQTQ